MNFNYFKLLSIEEKTFLLKDKSLLIPILLPFELINFLRFTERTCLIFNLSLVIGILSDFFLNILADFFGVSRWGLLGSNIILFGWRAAKLLFFDFDQLFFSVKFFHDVLFTHFIHFILLLLIADFKWLIIETSFFPILNIGSLLPP
jgi:hypothetical protein